jgi:DNA replication protein DnaC
MTATNDLEKSLLNLGFHYLGKHVADFCAQLTKKKLSPHETLEHIVRVEKEERLHRGVLRRVNAASLGRYRPLSEYDWNWPKKIDRDAIEELMKSEFVNEPANAIIFGPSGVGKTMIAKNIAYQAALAGHTALFVEASELLADLERQESPRLLKLRLRRYTSPKILVIDEVGYLSYSHRAADLLFQVITKRHEQSSTVLTTNLAFKDWGTVFPGAACIVSMIDRLTHRAEIISIEGESFRRKEAGERRMKKKNKGSEIDEPQT